MNDVFNAWNYPGPNPIWHRNQQERLRREWPVLARALDAMETPSPTPPASPPDLIGGPLSVTNQRWLSSQQRAARKAARANAAAMGRAGCRGC